MRAKKKAAVTKKPAVKKKSKPAEVHKVRVAKVLAPAPDVRIIVTEVVAPPEMLPAPFEPAEPVLLEELPPEHLSWFAKLWKRL